ncbi:MAG: hypothetical protein FJX42_04755 [Alphaproteobacteria bacterium]|nr:hypothetical protein [Alphaproteobacteria bacterium]
MTPEKPYNGGKIAVIAFTDAMRPRWLRFLAPGFRHCLALVRDAGRWTVINPMSHWTEITPLPAADGLDADDIAALLKAKGVAARVAAIVEPERRTAWPAPFTCVEAIKRLLGLRAPWVLTPAALARYLEKNHK